MVTFEDYNGNIIDINPAAVTSITTYSHVDTEEWNGEMDANGRPVPEHANETVSVRVIVGVGASSYIVKGSLDEVREALKTA